MKKFIFIFLLLPGLNSFAQKVEPYGDMTKPITVIFKEDKDLLEQRIIQNLASLQDVEIDSKTGKPKLEKRTLKPNTRNFSKDSDINVGLAQMDDELIKVWWMPPKPPPQKISEGGSNIKPVRSEITIEIGCLKTNRQASVVRVWREWTYNARTHVPYTEIPLLRGEDSNGGSYASDREWVHQLAPTKEFSTNLNDVVWDPEILEILKTLPVKSE
ncbi:MAG TPA: hypothetical protein VGH42_13970 [Verrucomicrobiae bacterium]|jgi:hypothetical protein